MLVISRKQGSSVRIGESVVKVLSIKGNVVKLGIEAPRETRIVRDDAKKREAA